MKLLLDEHYSRAIAEQLRKRGHDVVAAVDAAELKNQEDSDLLRWAVSQRRGVVSENAIDFLELHKQYLVAGKAHYGILLTSARSFPRTRAGIGKLVRALDKFLSDAGGEDALRLDVRWLVDG